MMIQMYVCGLRYGFFFSQMWSQRCERIWNFSEDMVLRFGRLYGHCWLLIFEYFRSHADDQWWLPTSQLLFARVPEFVWGPIWKWSKIYSTVRQTVNTTLNGWPPPCTEQRNMKYFLEKSVCQCISRRWLRGLFITPCQVGETSDIRSTPPIKIPLISPFFHFPRRAEHPEVQSARFDRLVIYFQAKSLPKCDEEVIMAIWW